MSAAGEGRGRAMLLIVFSLIYLLSQHSIPVHGATYTVGDNTGWYFDVVDWPNGKSFKADDVLVFNYDVGFHNVVVVDKSAYDSCTQPADAKVYESGSDKIKLVKGENFFICGYGGHCQAGMKIAVTAA